MKVTVIISTYNSPRWLERVLWGYASQRHKDFDIIIADDGSGEDTKQLIDQIRMDTSMEISHVWHEDRGYRRQTILNKAIVNCKSDYIIFTDGDCIPREDFVEVHVRLAEPGRFLSGGYCKISNDLSLSIQREDIFNQKCFNLSWLKHRGPVGFSQSRKLFVKEPVSSFFDAVTPAKPTFNNCNTSAWKKDILAVNGYDERMQYGGADREIGERLENAGIRGKQIRHRAICLHLYHERGYATKESIRKNLAIRKETRERKITRTLFGIEQNTHVLI
jgi:glycosyltransferase involved in cell wall biosynthesis